MDHAHFEAAAVVNALDHHVAHDAQPYCSWHRHTVANDGSAGNDALRSDGQDASAAAVGQRRFEAARRQHGVGGVRAERRQRAYGTAAQGAAVPCADTRRRANARQQLLWAERPAAAQGRRDSSVLVVRGGDGNAPALAAGCSLVQVR